MKSNLPTTHCPLCGNLVELSLLDIIACPVCHTKAKFGEEGFFKTDFDDGSVGYPEDGAAHTLEIEDKSFWFSHRHKVIEATMCRLRTTGIILDVGGGNGFEALRLQDNSDRIVLVEPGPSACCSAKKRGVRNVVNGTLESLDLTSNFFQGACFFDVIEHLENPNQILRETYRILEPEGRIFITVPAFNFLWSDEDVYAHHYRRYSEVTLRRELARAGFKIDYISYYFAPLVLPILIFRTLPSLLGKRRHQMNKNEHSSAGIIQKAINFLLGLELGFIRRGKRLSFGSSIICSATKMKDFAE